MKQKIDLPIEEIYHLFNTVPWYKKLYYLCILTKEQKILLKDYKNKLKNKINLKKEDFDFNNIFEINNLNLWYNKGDKKALKDININIKRNFVTALIGPSGCGKSTFLKCLNRANDNIPNILIEGDIYFEADHIFSKNMDILELRTKVGLVFQKPVMLGKSIYEEVAFALKQHGIHKKEILDQIVVDALKNVALYDEVSDDLYRSSSDLSGGQQQRLCIARTIALSPEVILMDEPTSALDPIATSKIEELILKLKNKFTIIIVTHSMAQAERISDETIFFYKGKVVEQGSTKQIFTNPKQKLTNDYIFGKL